MQVGGTPKNETRADGGQYGVCYFGDNYVCEQWALMHGECPVGGVKVTGLTSPAARNCEITGGDYTLIGTTNTGEEVGNCILPGGQMCDASELLRRRVPASSASPSAASHQRADRQAEPGFAELHGARRHVADGDTRGDGGQYSVCYFADNKQCEEWALTQGDCPVGGVGVAGYNTLAARYCAITGGKYVAHGHDARRVRGGRLPAPQRRGLRRLGLL